MKVMIVVTHLLGTGHLARALTLARAYRNAGDIACVVSGGTHTPLLKGQDITLVQLPPVRSDGVDFSRLLDPDGTPVTAAYMAARQAALLTTLGDFAPDVLITELFPFGRRILRDEFSALLITARAQTHPPLICASIRDILAPPSKPKKATYADDTIAAFYDAVLVHSDPALTPLEVSWPVSDRLRPMLRYTGFVAPPPAGPHRQGLGAGEIIVSAGGGNVGDHIYETALEAAVAVPQPMHLLVGGTTPQARITALRQHAPSHVTVEAARPDFRQMLYNAAASVSLCGYNTALDILQAGTPAVFVPFDEGAEVEQGLRAQALAQWSDITMIPRAVLTASSLRTAIESLIKAPRRNIAAHFDGAARTVEITREKWSMR
jgi:predicted glycosyltransferase